MKIFLLIIATVTLIACAKTKEQQVQANVKDYLMKHINDAKSYEFVEFGKLDSLFDSFYDTPRPKEIQDSMADALNELNYNDSISHLVDKLGNELDSLNSNYKPKFCGYVINHSFRGKNALGALILNEYRFEMDTNYVVLKAVEIKK